MRHLTATFDGTESFLRDHRIHGVPVLPAAMCVELARAAVAPALGVADGVHVEISSILWPRPFEVPAGPRVLHVAVRPDRDTGVMFELFSEDAGGTPTLHCRGRATSIDATVPGRIVLPNKSMSPAAGSSEFYDPFERAGLAFGPSHRAVTALQVGRDGVVAWLELAADVASSDHVVNPSILDGAFQAVQALPSADDTRVSLALPVSIQTLAIHARTSPRMCAVVRRSASVGADVDVVDQAGHIAVQVSGYVTRVLP
jgi:hypothetical protein